mmetsp:Transcript_3481/g.3227  ORF Transcript_3481/g.3227 Transcript_3481/m.3227 type:complete len:137 (+) Transcript_3481:39-449(+)
MTQNCEDKNSVFNGMFSLLFNFSDSSTSLSLPKILFDEENQTGDTEHRRRAQKLKDKSCSKSSRKRITACPHVNKRHYAKNMCNNCYHRVGRQKKAWACPHEERQLYAKGMCQFCYLQSYHKGRSCGIIKNESFNI